MDIGNRVLVIGLDGMGPQAMECLCARGAMPMLADLRRRGLALPLASTLPPFTCPAWPTMCTGVGPGRHGLFSFIRRGADGGVGFVSAADIASPRFWQLAWQVGLRVASIYVPTMFPADPVEPLSVSGYPAPDRVGAGAVYPPSQEELLRRAIPSFQASPFLDFTPRQGESPQQAVARVIRETAEADAHRVITAFGLAMAGGPLDMAMAVFSSTDHLFHPYYACLVAPDDAPPDVLAVRRALDEAFAIIDRAMARLIVSFGESATVLVVSDHGFAAKRGSVLVSECLRQAGLLRPSPLRYLVRRLVGRRRTDDIRRNVIDEDPWTDPAIDWSRTLAFAGYDHEQGVYVNLRGRNPRGIVPPDQQGAVFERVRAALLGVADPAGGPPPVKAVRRREDVYSGPFLDRAPDIMIELGDGWQVRRKLSWRMRGKPPVSRHGAFGGVHHPAGIIVAAGPAVRPGAEAGDVGLADVAATVLALLGLASLKPLDGRPRDDLFVFPASRRAVGAAAAPAAHAGGYSAEDEQKVAKRLEDLGYL